MILPTPSNMKIVGTLREPCRNGFLVQPGKACSSVWGLPPPEVSLGGEQAAAVWVVEPAKGLGAEAQPVRGPGLSVSAQGGKFPENHRENPHRATQKPVQWGQEGGPGPEACWRASADVQPDRINRL